MNENQKQTNRFLGNAILVVLGVLFLGFPLLFTQMTTDLFGLPKQVLLGGGGLIALILFGVQTVLQGQVKIRRTPFDLPILLLTIMLLLSGVFSLDRADALTAFVPFLLAVIVYFVVVNSAKTEKNVLFLLATLLGGASITAVLALLSFTQIFVLPMQYSHLRTFTPVGSLLDQALYLGFLLPLTAYLAYATVMPMFKNNRHEESSIGIQAAGFSISTLLIGVGFIITIIELMTLQKPLILPFSTGFQTAFAAISQDSGRIAQSFLFGSGFGTYLVDFTRFKSVAYNANPDLWAFTFFRSSSFVLELLATAGIVGFASYIYLIFKVIKDRPSKKEGGYGVFLAIIVVLIVSFIMPFSFIIFSLLFFMLAIFAAIQGLAHPNKVYDLSFGVFARKNLSFASEERQTNTSILSFLFLLVLVIIAGVLGWFGIKYTLSDVTFQQSLVAASQNNGIATYQLQNKAIGQFTYRDAYYRIFSQTNLALANSLALQQPKGQKVSTQTQQTIYTLVQQSINAGRSAVAISPANTLNWQNLSSIYRSLIGFGQNAEQFALAANQQALTLDANNPQEYINYGGIYYQLGQWDNAINQFSVAVNLKPDFANAHYNLGHALESKGDLSNALQQYQLVKQLVANDPVNNKKISDEIALLQAKIGAAGKAPKTTTSAANQPPLGVNNPPAQLPERNPKATIPGPGVSPKADKNGPTPTVVPTTQASPSPAQ